MLFYFQKKDYFLLLFLLHTIDEIWMSSFIGRKKYVIKNIRWFFHSRSFYVLLTKLVHMCFNFGNTLVSTFLWIINLSLNLELTVISSCIIYGAFFVLALNIKPINIFSYFFYMIWFYQPNWSQVFVFPIHLYIWHAGFWRICCAIFFPG